MALPVLDPNTALIVIDCCDRLATSGGVEATARKAYEQGLNVTLALDAMTDTSHEAHE
jgi:isochorismate hydrolase